MKDKGWVSFAAMCNIGYWLMKDNMFVKTVVNAEFLLQRCAGRNVFSRYKRSHREQDVHCSVTTGDMQGKRRILLYNLILIVIAICAAAASGSVYQAWAHCIRRLTLATLACVSSFSSWAIRKTI